MTGNGGPSRRGALLSRRAVLGGAVSVGAGAAAMKLLFSHEHDAEQDRRARPPWASPLASESARVAQLLRRTTFGVTPEALDAAVKQGFQRTVETFIETAPVEPPGLISADDPTHGAQLEGVALQKWWLEHILSSRAPFAERMTLFWHGHFTTSLDKVDALFAYWQNLSWRRLALGKLRPMLREVTIDPAMLTYLDLANSDASDASEPPNENYARELMELFTLGPGNYTEADVKAAAKALAGWTTPPADAQIEVVVDEATGAKAPLDVWNGPRRGVFAQEAAYDGEVTYLRRTGRFGLEAVVDRILAQPAATSFLSRKLASHFISPAPAEATVREIANAFRASDYDCKALMRAVLNSPEFGAGNTYRSLVKSPVEFMVGAAMAVGAEPKKAAEVIVNYGDATGQSLFQPPNVSGWPANGRWVSPSTMLARFNFVSELLDAVATLPTAHNAEHIHLDGVLGSAIASRLARASSDKERWMVILTSPEFNLK
jgi:uncharacterized protein (DUF1800 family)